MDSEVRLELKYPTGVAGCCAIQRWLREDGLVLRRAYPDRVVSNVYFDTPTWTSYHANQSGDGDRLKCRIRWYGAMSPEPSARFEVKRRRGDFLHKEVHPLELGDPPSSWSSLPASCARQLPRAVQHLWQRYHLPTLFNTYRRQYFVWDAVRFTIDTNMLYGSATRDRIERDAKALRKSHVHTVFEVKLAPTRREQAERLLRGFPLAAGRHSKYAIGVRQTL